MTQLIVEEQIFRKELYSIGSLIDKEKTIPEQVFDSRLSNFAFISIEDIFSEEFFDKMKKFLSQINENDFRVFAIEPDPESYFYHNFGKYPLLMFSMDSTAQQYVSAVFADPGESPADAIGYNSSSLLVYSSSYRWAIYGSRDFEVGIFASESTALSDIFHQIYDDNLDVETAIEHILEPAWVNEFPVDLRTQLLTNYSN